MRCKLRPASDESFSPHSLNFIKFIVSLSYFLMWNFCAGGGSLPFVFHLTYPTCSRKLQFPLKVEFGIVFYFHGHLPTTYLLKLMTITSSTNIKDLACFRLCGAVTRFWHHRRRALFSPCVVPPCRLSLCRFAPIIWGTPSLPFPWGPGTPLWPEDSVPQMCFGERIATLTDLNSFWSQVGVLKL